MSRKRVYLIGSDRTENIRPSLQNAFDIVSPGSNPLPRPFRNMLGLEQAGKFIKYVEPVVFASDTDKEKPVVITDSVGLFPLIVGLLCRRQNIPFIVRLRGGMWKGYRDRAHSKSWFRKKAYSLRKDFVRNRVLSMADGIIPVAEFIRTQVLYELETNIEDVQTVHNPIESTSFDAAEANQFKRSIGLSSDDNLILTITNFNYHRKYSGVTHFVPAIERVLRDNPEWHFAVAGSGNQYEQGKRAIRERFAADVRNRVHFTGFYTPIEEALIDTDIALHLSFHDGAPWTVLEAQAARTPVLVNSAGGMPELLDRSGAEIPVVVDGVDALYSSLEALVEDPERRRTLGERNKEHVETEFSPAKIAAEFRTAIEDILS